MTFCKTSPLGSVPTKAGAAIMPVQMRSGTLEWRWLLGQVSRNVVVWYRGTGILATPTLVRVLSAGHAGGTQEWLFIVPGEIRTMARR